MTNLSMKKGDIIATLVIVPICFYVFYESGKWPAAELIGIGSPSFIPRGVATCLLFAAGMLLFRALRGRALMLESKLEGANLRRVSAAALLTGAYVFVVERVGFIGTTFLYMLFFVLVLGERRWLRLVMFALLVPAVAYVIFSTILHVPLPRGWFR
jgi:putative tricarboxylic transport membrane protein